MRKSPHLNIRSLIERFVILTSLLFFWHVNGMGADFADRHLRLYLSVGWKALDSVPTKDEMKKVHYGNVSETSGGYPTIGIGDGTLLYSFNPKLSIGIQYWITRTPTLKGIKTLPLTFYAYDEGAIDTTTYIMQIQGREDFFVNVFGPAIQWTLTTNQSKQLYIRGMAGICIYSPYLERFATWSSGGPMPMSVMVIDKDSPNLNTYGASFTLGGDVHSSWISFGIEAAIRFSQAKTFKIPQRRAGTVLAGGYTVTPEEGGIILPAEKRTLSFWGVSLGVVVGLHAF